MYANVVPPFFIYLALRSACAGIVVLAFVTVRGADRSRFGAEVESTAESRAESLSELTADPPAEIKASVVGYGRADKNQMQQMVKLLLGLDTVPSPHDAADVLAVAMCHVHACGPVAQAVTAAARLPRHLRSWRHVKPSQLARRQVP